MSEKHERKAGNRRNKRERKNNEPTERKLRETDRLVRVRYSKKSLPGFLAKNAGAILQWLKEYETLYNLADDYGFQNMDRVSPARREVLQDNYVKISEFISTVEAIIAGEDTPDEIPDDIPDIAEDLT